MLKAVELRKLRGHSSDRRCPSPVDGSPTLPHAYRKSARAFAKRAQMEAAGLDTASTDVWKYGVLHRCEERSDNLQDVCLEDFVAHYNVLTYQKRRDPAVTRYRCYSTDKSLNYTREAVTLFLPFRREVDIWNDNAFEHMYGENVNALLLKTSQYDSEFDIHQLRRICLQMCTDDAHSSELHTATDPRHVPFFDQNNDEDLVGPPDANSVAAKGRCAAVCMRQDVMPGDTYREIMRLANREQFEVFREVIHRLATPTSDPLRILTPIMNAYNSYTNAASTCTHNAYVACATTGQAAVAIGGLTLHAAFKHSMRADGGLPFTNVKCVIVDECSMISSDTPARVDDRLRQNTGKYDLFGGLDFMCDDLRQLPPIRARECPTERAIFSAALPNIGDGHALEKRDVDMFQVRFVSKHDVNSRCPHAMRLFYSNKDAEAYNTQDAVQDGGTYSEVVYDCHQRHPQKLVYVALSRATTPYVLYLTNAENDFIFCHCRENPDRALSDELRQLQSHQLNTIAAKCFAVLHSPYSLALCNVTLCSLPAYAFDVSHDHVIREVPVLCLSETWTDTAVELLGYTCVSLAKRHEHRAAGVAVYEHFGVTTLSPRSVP
ncbi:hypothetical protein HPB49_023330 [Dermacentor silvarum]|uniref:Uncharacterized protein n=1 Tax=Dermacentor silvarum TaxID=543639 RepID=A0ACB8D8I9_DERSI|nr:hypothetical protein HPB49_023330 [Dermacentor silvarum]